MRITTSAPWRARATQHARVCATALPPTTPTRRPSGGGGGDGGGARHRRFPSPRERRRERTRERKGRIRGFLDGGIAPKGAQTHSRRPTSARKQGRRQKFLGTREEDEERTTAACDVPAEVQRLEPPTRAPRGAGARARARLLAQRGRRGAARRQREESARLLRGARRAQTNAEDRDDGSAVHGTRGRFEASTIRSEGAQSGRRSSDSRRPDGLGRGH